MGVWQWNPLERGYCSIKYIFEKTTTKYIFWAVTGFKIFETDARYRNAGWCCTAFIALQPWRKPKTKSIHNTCMHTTKTKPELDNKEQKGTHNQVSWEVKSKNKTNNRKYFSPRRKRRKKRKKERYKERERKSTEEKQKAHCLYKNSSQIRVCCCCWCWEHKLKGTITPSLKSDGREGGANKAKALQMTS